jgi:hypothetical protein
MEGLVRNSEPRQSTAKPPFEPTPLLVLPNTGRDRSNPRLSGLTHIIYLERFWLCLLIAAVGLLFATAPQHGDFWWSDAPRHALNGVFLLDLFREMPLADPVGFAKSYYAQYPALSILFYPPLFPLAEMPVYALFGVSHFSAQLTVALHETLLACGVFLLARRFLLSSVRAFAAALLFIGVHEVAYWGRQVMLEIPVYTWLVWAALMYLRYLDTHLPRFIYGMALFILGALYTKQTAVFAGAALAGLLLFETWGAVLRDRHFRIAALLSAVALVPLAVMTLKFGQVNLNASAGETGGELSRLAWENWTYYARRLPGQLGWPVLILALLYPAAYRLGPGWRLPPIEARLLCVWFGFGYLFFSLIALKEPRHSLLILLPVVLFAVAAVVRWLPPQSATGALLALALGQYVYTVSADRPPSIVGYDQAAGFVARAAPAQSLILFSGYRDGSFVFNLRAQEQRGDLGVLRSDKLLLRVKVKRELGVEQRGLTQDQLAAALDRYGVSYVVNEPEFWNDLEAMQVLQNLLHTPQFVKVAEIPVTGNVPHKDRVLEVYRNRHYIPDADKERPPLELLIIDQVI